MFTWFNPKVYLILNTKLTGGGSASLLSSCSDPDDPADISMFIGRESVSLSLDPPSSCSSSLDHTHSPVSFRWRRPDAPGCLLEAFKDTFSFSNNDDI